MVSHDIKKGEGVAQVVCVVFDRLGNGLANGLEAGKVNDKANGVLVKDVVECICVVDVCLVERKALSVLVSHNGFDAIDNLCRSIGKVINNYGLVAGIEQFNNGVAANKARATGDKYAGILWNQSVRHINPFVDYIVISIRLFCEALCGASTRVSRQVRVRAHGFLARCACGCTSEHTNEFGTFDSAKLAALSDPKAMQLCA